MERKPIILFQERNLGGKVNVTLEFVRRFFKPLVLSLLYIAGPWAIMAGIAQGLFQITSLSLKNSPWDTLSSYASIQFLASLLFSSISYILSGFTIFSFLTLYEEHGDKVTITPGMVWSKFKDKLVPGSLTMVLCFIVILVAFLCLVIPGFYMAVALQFVVMIVIRENLYFKPAIDRSMNLIRNHWWPTFSLMFVMGLVSYVLFFAFQIPTFIIQVIDALSLRENSVGVNSGTNTFSLLSVGSSILSIIGNTLMNGILSVAMGFQYYHLLEKKEGIGLRTQIGSIGQDDKTHA